MQHPHRAPIRAAFRAGVAFVAVAGFSAGALAQAPAKGGGDNSLQKNLAEPAPMGTQALSVETLAEGLVNPWCVAFLPDGALLVTERAGRLRVIRDGALVAEPVANTPAVYVDQQAGMFDVLPHPDFAANGLVYLSYAHGDKSKNALRVARARFDGAALSDLEVVYEAAPLKQAGFHFGGKLVFHPDGKLYVSVGEGSRYKELAQDAKTSFGAIVRLNEDGSIPADNPSLGHSFGEGARPELYTKGHRNPQGLAYDAARGILWETEHGPRGGDEINVVKPGANYGWPFASYGIDYNGARITPFTEYDGTEQPVKYWTPSIAPSGLAVYAGDLFPEWEGDLLVGALAGAALHRVDLDADGKPVGEERYLADRAERIRDVRVGPDGAVYVTTEDRGGKPAGKLLRLTPAN